MRPGLGRARHGNHADTYGAGPDADARAVTDTVAFTPTCSCDSARHNSAGGIDDGAALDSHQSTCAPDCSAAARRAGVSRGSGDAA